MNVWLLQTGEPLHVDAGNPRPMRAMNLANTLVESGHKVVVWSSAFYHQEKRHRAHAAERVVISSLLEIRLIPSPGYRRNIGIGRLWDHAVLARNLARQLAQETSVPDVAFVGYPPIEAAAVMTRWLSDRGVPSLLDIKDQWPAVFVGILPKSLRPLGRAALLPYYQLAKRAMRDASGLSAMTEGFLQWAAGFAGRSRGDNDQVVPLTSPIGQVPDDELAAAREWWSGRGIMADGRPRVCFVGSHSPSFDFEPVYEAARSFAARDGGCEFVICGSGSTTPTLRKMMSGLGNVSFPGWVDQAQIATLAERSFAALAPYRDTDDFAMSIPNKVIDALSLGLPVLSPLRGEVAELITTHRAGLRYATDSMPSLAQAIQELIDNPAFRHQLSMNAHRVYQESYAFERVYGGLVSHLEDLARSARRWGRTVASATSG